MNKTALAEAAVVQISIRLKTRKPCGEKEKRVPKGVVLVCNSFFIYLLSFHCRKSNA